MLFASFNSPARPDDPMPMDGIHAIVGDAIITVQQVRLFMGPSEDLLIRQYGNRNDFSSRWNNLFAESATVLIRRQLILQDFKTSGFKLPESIIDEIVQDRIKQQFSDRAQFTKQLQQRGQTYEAYRKDVRDQLIESEMSRKYVPDPVISPHKIDVYYQEHLKDYFVGDQVNLRMIVRNKAPGDTSDATRKMMQEIQAQIKAGAAFAQMAEIYSEGSLRSQGGLTGWQEVSAMSNKPLVDALKTLKPGGYSDIIDTPTGCYLLLLEESRPAHNKPLSEVRDEIEGKLRRFERARMDEKWISRLKKKTLVRILG